MNIYTVYDSKAAAHLPPFVATNHHVAFRMIAKAALDQDHDFGRFGADYTLFQIGTWNELDGRVDQLDANLNLGTALTIVNTLTNTEE